MVHIIQNISFVSAGFAEEINVGRHINYQIQVCVLIGTNNNNFGIKKRSGIIK